MKINDSKKQGNNSLRFNVTTFQLKHDALSEVNIPKKKKRISQQAADVSVSAGGLDATASAVGNAIDTGNPSASGEDLAVVQSSSPDTIITAGRSATGEVLNVNLFTTHNDM